MELTESFDLSTPEGRHDRGIYDADIDVFIPEEVRVRVANYIAENPVITSAITLDSSSTESIL